MADPNLMSRKWSLDLLPDEVRLRCAYLRRGKRILQFTVQLEMRYSGDWKPVVRYDNAHGFCHRDTIHRDGTQDKTAIFVGDANTTFTRAIEDLRANWQDHRARFLREAYS